MSPIQWTDDTWVPMHHTQWATIAPPEDGSRRWRLCLWGDEASAREGCDPDERVCRVRVQILELHRS
jgi:hypothetical protein